MLTFSHVSVTRSGREILTDVSFTVPAGEITVLLGKNGSGKSTLLGCVNGLIPYTGQIVCGEEKRNLATLSPGEKAKIIALLPQSLPDTALTVYDLVAMGRTPYIGSIGRLSVLDKERIQWAMERVGISGFAGRMVQTLSSGEKQAVYLAMLLAQDTPVLLFDEPGTYLDADARRGLMGLLGSLAADGKTILLVMHELSDAVEIGSTVVVLGNGRCVFAGNMEDCLTGRVLEDVFGVRRYVAIEDGDKKVFFA